MNAFAGTGKLLRLAVRRDRLVLTLWLVVLFAFMAGTTHMSVVGLPTQADIDSETRVWANSPALRLMSLSSGATLGSYVMIRSWMTVAVLAAVMSVLCVTRHTRQNEESGRAELFRAGIVGPSAAVAAGVIVALGANVVLVPLLALSMILNGLAVGSSFAAGAAVAGVGVAFTGIAALTSQLSSTARGANGLAMAALGVAFVVGGVGTMLGHTDDSGLVAYAAWPTWLSPIGWGLEMRPFGGDRWWLLALPLALCAGLVVVAARYAARRDLGRGLLPVQTGAAEASPRLRGPFGLAWRLQRAAFISWLVAMLCTGLIFGSISDTATTASGESRDWYEKLAGSTDMQASFFTSFIEMAGMMVAIYVVQVLLRMHEEESRARLEAIVATGVTRLRWALSYVVTAAVGATVLLLAFAVPMALAAGQVVGGTSDLLGELTGAALAQLPAVLAIGAIVVAAFALVPRRAVSLSWLVVAAAILMSPVFGSSLRLPQWAIDISPFTHQKAPAADVDGPALVIVVVVAVVAAAAGLAAFRRRDLAAG